LSTGTTVDRRDKGALSPAPVRVSWGLVAPSNTLIASTTFLVAGCVWSRMVWLRRIDAHQHNPAMFVWFAAATTWASFFALLRGGSTLDAVKGRLSRWWGPMIPLKVAHIPFGSIRGIAIGDGIRPGSPKSVRRYARSYHVAVKTDDRHYVIRVSKSLEDVRFHAQRVSEAAKCPVEEFIG